MSRPKSCESLSNPGKSTMETNSGVAVKEEIVKYITENFVVSDSFSLDESASFMENGILDSTGILELIGFIEEAFEIEVDDEEMIPENLDSIQNAVAFVMKKSGAN